MVSARKHWLVFQLLCGLKQCVSCRWLALAMLYPLIPRKILEPEKKERVVQGYHAANGMIIGCAIIIYTALELFHGPIIELFLGKSGTMAAMQTENSYLLFMEWFFCLFGFKMTVDGLLRGSGDMKMFTVANLVNLTIRVVLAMTLAPRFGIAFVWYAVPIGWLANWIISFAQYRTGKWRSNCKAICIHRYKRQL